MHYREYPPGPATAQAVVRYWTLEVRDVPVGHAHRVLPDGCLDVVVVRRGASGHVVLRGPRDEPLLVPVGLGDRFWGIRLWPDAGPKLLGVPAARLVGTMMSAGTLLGDDTGELPARLAELPGEAGVEQPATAARRQAMAKLDFLVGEWSGPAWAMYGTGQRMEMRQAEKVRYALGGQVLLVEGIGQRLVNGVPADTVLHAAATIDWMPGRGYLMRFYTLGGHFGEFPLEVVKRGFVWQAPAPGGKVTYTMRLTDDGTWDERGVYEGDGRTMPAVQLTVKKK